MSAHQPLTDSTMNSPAKFKYSIACPTLAWTGYDVVEDPEGVLDAIRAAGFDGADLPVEGITAKRVGPILQALGLEVPEIMGIWGYVHSAEDRDLSSMDGQIRKRGIDYSRAALNLAAELKAQFFNICAAQPSLPQVPFPRQPISVLRKNFAASLREICDYAASCRVTVLLEPLNLYEAIPGVLTTIDEAIGFIKDLGVDNLGLQPDVFHMNISEASITDALRTAAPWARVVHLNETNHYQLGTGHADYPAIIKVLKDCRFNGYVTVYAPLVSQEVFLRKSRAADRPHLRAVLAEQLALLKQIESEVDVRESSRG